MTLIIAIASILSMQAMSNSSIRQHARFLSDRMAYELDLAPWQYEECYEINYDFIYAADRIMDDVVFGYYDAIDAYYRYLDNRNDDLHYVLNATQYRKFMTREYFFRPIYTSGRNWEFRIYTIYSNRSFYYYDAPRIYKDYRGEHSRHTHANGYYATRKPAYTGHHEIYRGNDYHIIGSSHYDNHGRNDFGANRVQRPQDNSKPKRDNYYSNGNQKNRTHDNRYHDNSGNQHSPEINHPRGGTQSGSVRGDKPGQTKSNNGQSNSSSRGNSQGSSASQPVSRHR